MSKKLEIIGQASQFIQTYNDRAEYQTVLQNEGYTAEAIADGQTRLDAARDGQTAYTNAKGGSVAAK